LGNSVQSIGVNAFNGNQLGSVVLPESLVKGQDTSLPSGMRGLPQGGLGTGAFKNNKLNRNVIIPKGMPSVESAFDAPTPTFQIIYL
jgi:hypothetical protein